MRRLATLLAVIAILLTALPASAVSGDPTAPGTAKTGRAAGNNVYIVQLSGPPAAAYEGGVAGIRATAPRAGERLDVTNPDVIAYTDHLQQQQADVLASVAASDRLVYNYTLAFNGFAARLTAAEAAALRAQPGVVSVVRDQLRRPQTMTTPQLLGLQNPDGTPAGLWAEGIFGENVVVGVIDSGIWPESPSFSDRIDVNGVVTDEPTYDRYRPFRGACIPGEEFEVADCNNKLIGARWYNEGFGGDAAVKALFSYEYASARDADGHGTHTASTAAGNRNVEAVVDGNLLGLISGMAPRARIAAYKVCWGRDESAAGCAASDSVAAIDQAVADRVDVLNYSVGPNNPPTNFSGPEEIAFLFAARAGVFVATSAGNTGPGVATVTKNSPWTTTVAASTHTRSYNATVQLGDGSEYSGQSSSNTGAGPAPLILSTAAGLAGADPDEVRLCFPGTLDPARVAGKIVLCDRGVNNRIEKSQVVRDAGGVGMILANVSPNSLNADIHFVPTIHVDEVAGAAIKAYVATAGAGATAQLFPYNPNSITSAPAVAEFSSRGPISAGQGDFLQPDILAPGVDVLAAVSPAANGRNFDLMSGTSMASPHVAGLAALIVQKHPRWSPGMIKSALMTTATQTQVNAPPGTLIPGTPFDFGAGFVNVNAAVDPGLVYNARFNHWITFLCGVEPGLVAEDTCSALDALGYSTEPTNHNTPSIAIGALAGVQTIRRTVTNVGSDRATYHVQVDAPAGFEVRVKPDHFTLDPGQRKRFTMRFTNTGANLNAYVSGSLTWSDGEHDVRIPIVVQPVGLAAPGEFVGSGATGSATLDVGFGYTGPYSPTVSGLVAAQETQATLPQDPDQSFDPSDPAGTLAVEVEVPAGTPLARFQLFDAYTDGDDDLDLYVFDSAGDFVGVSGTPTAAEVVTLVEPPADTYTIFVHAFATDGPDVNFTLFSWVVPPADAGNLTVTGPSDAATGETHPVTLAWNVAAGTKYLGVVHHNDPGTPPAATVVRVDADPLAGEPGAPGGMELTPDPEPEAPAEGEEGALPPIYLPFVGN